LDNRAHEKGERAKERDEMASRELDVLKKLIREYRTTKTCKVIVKKCKKVGKNKEDK
jgi:hypothetical protein